MTESPSWNARGHGHHHEEQSSCWERLDDADIAELEATTEWTDGADGQNTNIATQIHVTPTSFSRQQQQNDDDDDDENKNKSHHPDSGSASTFVVSSSGTIIPGAFIHTLATIVLPKMKEAWKQLSRAEKEAMKTERNDRRNKHQADDDEDNNERGSRRRPKVGKVQQSSTHHDISGISCKSDHTSSQDVQYQLDDDDLKAGTYAVTTTKQQQQQQQQQQQKEQQIHHLSSPLLPLPQNQPPNQPPASFSYTSPTLFNGCGDDDDQQHNDACVSTVATYHKNRHVSSSSFQQKTSQTKRSRKGDSQDDKCIDENDDGVEEKEEEKEVKVKDATSHAVLATSSSLHNLDTLHRPQNVEQQQESSSAVSTATVSLGGVVSRRSLPLSKGTPPPKAKRANTMIIVPVKTYIESGAKVNGTTRSNNMMPSSGMTTTTAIASATTSSSSTGAASSSRRSSTAFPLLRNSHSLTTPTTVTSSISISSNTGIARTTSSSSSSSSSNQNQQQPTFKYVETIRKQDERYGPQMKGFTCLQCGRFFAALAAGAAASGINITNFTEADLCKCASRHRSRFEPDPNTPPGYWDLDDPVLESSPPQPANIRILRTNPDQGEEEGGSGENPKQ